MSLSESYYTYRTTLDDGFGHTAMGTTGARGPIGTTGAIGPVGLLGTTGSLVTTGGLATYNTYESLNYNSYDPGVFICGDLTLSKLSDKSFITLFIDLQKKVEDMDKQIKIMTPIVNMYRDKSARLIQKTWHDYLYAPGKGKYYKIGKKSFNRCQSSLLSSETSCHSSSL
jgi:hypothetical protein